MNKKVKVGVFAAILMLFCVCGYSQTVPIKGKIVDRDNAPLPGVNVLVQGTSKGTVSDVDGNYVIDVNPDGFLIFSFVGYISQTVAATNRTVIDVTLLEEVKALNEVVVIGYGTARKRDLTGAVTQIKTSALENEKPLSVQDVLRGKVAGLNVGFSTSAKSGGNLEVRGTKSLRDDDDATRSANYPLLVLDGGIYTGSIDDINPADIETIDLLKDASSAAVYGAKAASGVLAITTKRGKTGKPVINVNASVGLSQLATMPAVYSPEGFLNWRTEVFKSKNRYGSNKDKLYIFDNPDRLPSGVSLSQWLDGSSQDPTSLWLSRIGLVPNEIKNYADGKSVDWRDMVFRTGFNQDHNISLSGRKDEVSYYWSLGYNNTQGVRERDDYSVYRSRLNVEGKITDFLTVGTNTQFSYRDESAIPADWEKVRTNSPWGSIYTDDGTRLRYSPTDNPGGGAVHPLYQSVYQDRLKTYTNLNANLYAKVTLPFGISYQLSYVPHWQWYTYYNHESVKSDEWSGKGGGAERRNEQISEWQVDNLIKWDKTFGDHHFDLTLLANAEKYQSWMSRIMVEGFLPNDALGYHQTGSVTSTQSETNDEYSTADALMARLFYVYKDRYMTTLSVRRDGYSAFGQHNPRGTFASVALGWVFSEESFVDLPWLSFGKLRASWGTNGNRNIGRYASFSTMTSGSGKYPYQTGSVVTESPQLYVNQMANQYLKWEKTENINFGLDFGFLDGRISGNLDVYRMNTVEILLNRKLLYVIGFPAVTSNLGEVKNTGFELSLNADILKKENLGWSTGLTFSLNRNEIVHLYRGRVDVVDDNGNVIGQKEPDDIINKRFIGHALDAVWDYRVLGVWQEGEEGEATKFSQAPGDFRIKDNGDYKPQNDDKEFLGFKEPRFRWNWSNRFNVFKQFEVSFMMYSYWGHYGTFNQAKNRDGFLDRNNSYILPYYTPEHPQSKYARLESTDPGNVGYDIWRKKSFIRLDNIAIAYNLPHALIQKAKIQNFKVYASVRNVCFYAPDWELWDPEASGPTPRLWTLGVNISL